MTDGMTVSIMIAIGVIIAAVIGTLITHRRRKQQKSTSLEFTNDSYGEQPIQDITGIWHTEYSDGLASIDTLIIESQIGLEVVGRRILRHPKNNSMREYDFRGFFTGDLLSGALVHGSSAESRTLALLLRPRGSTCLQGRMLRLMGSERIEATEILEWKKR